MRKVIIVIPAYNEAARIGKVITSLPKTIICDKESFKTHVVVVEDGSNDGTYDEAKKTSATVLRHIINSGAGAATRTGLRYAERNSKDVAYVVTIDADGQHSTDDVKKLLNFAIKNKADMVVGNRLHAGNKKSIPLHRSLGNRALGLVGRVLFGIKIEDTQSGLRLYRMEIVPLISNYTIDRYGFCTEMLWLAIRKGVKVQEVPISVKYSSDTLNKGQSNWGAIDLLLDLLWIRITE
jgi:glycosyltransferase involved in cell wall biosynthesis